MRSYGSVPFLASRSKKRCRLSYFAGCKLVRNINSNGSVQRTIRRLAKSPSLRCALDLVSNWRRRLERCESRSAGIGEAFTTSLKLWRELQCCNSFLKWGGSESRGPVSVKVGNWIPLRCALCFHLWWTVNTYTQSVFFLLQIVCLLVF